MTDTDPKGSPKRQLNAADMRKVGTGAVLMGTGVCLTALIEYLLTVDFGDWTPVVAGGLAVLSNLVRKYFKDTQ